MDRVEGRHRLSARLWLPETSDRIPAPIVWEYIPYRKRDLYRPYDDVWGHQLAQYGIAYARVDARGSGDSQGILVDEYLDQELNDGVEVIAWLARQPWSNGAVGMRGISWGGINTLQIAALAPPTLRAIMPMCCTDTRYTDDAHYIGGALGLTDLQWGVQFKAVMALPPDPAIVGDGWRDQWQQRLDASPPILQKWAFAPAQRCVLAAWLRVHGLPSDQMSGLHRRWLGGHLCQYRDPHTRQRVGAAQALIGPWAHNYPQASSPGPSLDWTYEEVRWWKHWLAGVPTGIMDEPMFRAYMPYRTSSEIYPLDTPGRWIAESRWPSPRTRARTWYLDEGRLSPTVGARGEVIYVGDKIVGLQKPEWLPFPPEGMPGEQTPDDLKSLLFDSAPLKSTSKYWGTRSPAFGCRPTPVAKLALRLCEVSPEGKSWLVTYGLLNLTHRKRRREAGRPATRHGRTMWSSICP